MDLAALYDRHVMPRLIGCACGSRPVTRQRRKVVPLAQGRVLELGIGGGLNLAFYDPARVSEVIGVDPSPELRARADAAPRPAGLSVDVREGTAEALPFDVATFDTVVTTFTLCTVADPARTLAEARRVLRPGGALIFCEHGLAPDGAVARWQRRIEPVWKPLAGGCHLTRPPAGMLREAGFAIDWLDSMYLPKTPRPLGWNEWGIAHAAPVGAREPR